ncbi:MAG: F0F1 ATP synthase subunit delta [Acidimicrobiia bacterium]|jgi:F-type H+-transporting ATPase subunit b
MLIDWFTVFAQLVNFAILLVALKFLLYDRIIKAMEERRHDFAQREQETRRLRREAEEEAKRIEEDRREIEANWEDMIEEARREAEDRRHELLEEARTEVEEQERKWRESIRSRQEQLLSELQRSTGEQATAITRRALVDLANTDLEREMIDEFIERLHDLVHEEEDDEIIDAFRADAAAPLLVRTSFEPAEEQRDEIRKALRDLVQNPEREIEWERDPDLVAGIEVRVGARSIGWTIDTYLDDLHGTFAEMLRRQIEEAASPERGEDESLPAAVSDRSETGAAS